MATLPKTWGFTAFLARHTVTSVHALGEDAPKHWHLQHCGLYTTYCGTRHAVTAGVHAISEDALKTLVFAAFLPLCTLFCLFVQHKQKNAVHSVCAREESKCAKHLCAQCYCARDRESLVAVVILRIDKTRHVRPPQAGRRIWGLGVLDLGIGGLRSGA